MLLLASRPVGHVQTAFRSDGGSGTSPLKLKVRDEVTNQGRKANRSTGKEEGEAEKVKRAGRVVWHRCQAMGHSPALAEVAIIYVFAIMFTAAQQNSAPCSLRDI